MGIGKLIAGRYRILGKVGEGAMGIVYLAENVVTRRKVALKQVSGRSAPHQRRRLLREAQACGSLSHRNIIEVLDYGETDEGAPFIVMPLLSGETLADLLVRKRRLEPWLAARIGRDCAAALAVAHAAGVVHRDLKPANIFLHREPGLAGALVKVLDFGVCKILNPKETVLTEPGKVIGSLAYMSPEQLVSESHAVEEKLDSRADLWALGVILFEMLTGVRPFQGDRADVMVGIINGEVPKVTQHVRTVPLGLAYVVSRCLTRERAQRISTAEELVAILSEHSGPDTDGIFTDVAAPSAASSRPEPTSATLADADVLTCVATGVREVARGSSAAPKPDKGGDGDDNAVTLPLDARALQRMMKRRRDIGRERVGQRAQGCPPSAPSSRRAGGAPHSVARARAEVGSDSTSSAMETAYMAKPLLRRPPESRGVAVVPRAPASAPVPARLIDSERRALAPPPCQAVAAVAAGFMTPKPAEMRPLSSVITGDARRVLSLARDKVASASPRVRLSLVMALFLLMSFVTIMSVLAVLTARAATASSRAEASAKVVSAIPGEALRASLLAAHDNLVAAPRKGPEASVVPPVEPKETSKKVASTATLANPGRTVVKAQAASLGPAKKCGKLIKTHCSK